MSAGDVAVLNTKLDSLIDDFKSFKRYVLGFLMALVIPFATYIVISLADNDKRITVLQEIINFEQKAIKEEK